MMIEGKVLFKMDDMDKVKIPTYVPFMKKGLEGLKQVINQIGKPAVEQRCTVIFVRKLEGDNRYTYKAIVICLEEGLSPKEYEKFEHLLFDLYYQAVTSEPEILNLQSLTLNEIALDQPMSYYTSDENPDMYGDEGLYQLYLLLNNAGMVLNYYKVSFF